MQFPLLKVGSYMTRSLDMRDVFPVINFSMRFSCHQGSLSLIYIVGQQHNNLNFWSIVVCDGKNILLCHKY